MTVKTSSAAGSHFRAGLFSGSNLPASLLDGQGEALFKVSNTGASAMTLTRTGVEAVGAYSCDLAIKKQLWNWTAESKVSTWRIGKSSTYTFASQPFVNWPCTQNSNGSLGFSVDGNRIYASGWFLNCGTMYAMANGKSTSGFKTESQVGWAHIIPESGRIKSVDASSYGTHVLKPVDGKTPGVRDDRQSTFRLSWRNDVDISTYGKAVENLPVGSVAVVRQDDGSWDFAYNVGSRLPGLSNSLKMPDSSDSTTLELQRNTGNIWQVVGTGFLVYFQDEEIPNRVSIETQGTEYAHKVQTLTTKPVEPPVGQGQSAIRYDPNGGDGDAFRKAGDPGTTATTAEAGIFLRKGYTFAGWNTKADGTGTAYQAGANVTYPAEGDTLTLYARWRPITYAIRFDGNKATSGTMADLTATYDAKATLPADGFKRAGYAFAGWNTKTDGTGTAYRDKGEVTNLASSQGDVVVLYTQRRGLVTVLPDTGGHATHMPFIVGTAVTAAALALAVMARRRGGRHAV